MGKPIITTDHVGCREVVDNGVNGYLCDIQDIESLRCYIKKFILLSENETIILGLGNWLIALLTK